VKNILVLNYSKRWALIILALLLASCQQASHDDIHAFITSNKEHPPGKIKPLKRYPPYKPYNYRAQQLRGPFTPPYDIEKKVFAATSNVKPDVDRQKQRLESFDFSSLSMVGTVKQGDILWGLIRDPEGSIERVKTGYFLGKNNGKITDISNQSVDVIEIVSNGSESWLERPNVISLKER
jgi:type IV pilus assembly protein PilP